MSIWLVMRTAEGGERLFPIKKRVVVGRDPRCQVRIALPSVCEQHCAIELIEGTINLTDLESENGTYHNGRRVQSAELADADMLTIGPVTFEVRVTEDEPDLRTLKPVKEVLKSPEINIVPRQASEKQSKQ